MSRALQHHEHASGRALPLFAAVTNVDRHTDASDIVRHAFRAAQIEGHEPFVQSASFDHPVAARELLPDDWRVERSATTDSSVVAFARSPRGGVLISVSPRSAMVVASAATAELAEAIVAEVCRRVPAPCDDGTVPIRTWHMGCDGRLKMYIVPPLDVSEQRGAVCTATSPVAGWLPPDAQRDESNPTAGGVRHGHA